MSVKTKLITALTLILLVAFLATSLINYAFTRATVREELLNSSLPLTGKNIYSEVHADMLRPILVSTSMANDAFLKNWIRSGEKDLGAITRYLSDLRNKYGFLTTFFVSAKTDNYYYQDGILKKIGPRDPHDVWYFAFVRKDVEFALDVDTNEAEQGKLTIFVNFRVEDEDGRLLGVAGVGVSIDRVTGLLEKARKEYHREVYLVDQDGLVQVHRDKIPHRALLHHQGRRHPRRGPGHPGAPRRLAQLPVRLGRRALSPVHPVHPGAEVVPDRGAERVLGPGLGTQQPGAHRDHRPARLHPDHRALLHHHQPLPEPPGKTDQDRSAHRRGQPPRPGRSLRTLRLQGGPVRHVGSLR